MSSAIIKLTVCRLGSREQRRQNGVADRFNLKILFVKQIFKAL